MQESVRNRDIDSLYKIYSGLGHVYLELKDFPKSEENYVKAISFIEDVGAAPLSGENTSHFKTKPFFGEYSKLYEGMIKALVRLGSIEEAFTYSEKLKLISFSENFIEVRPKDIKKMSENLLIEEQKNAARINALRSELDAVYRNRSWDAAGGIEVEFQSAKERSSRFVEKLRNICPDYASIKYPKAARPPGLNLKSDESLLEFEVTNEEVYLFRIDGRTKKVKVKNVNLSRQKIKELVSKYRDNLNASKNKGNNKNLDKKYLRKLYEVLLGDFIEDLPADSKLIIVPDEDLNAISFEPLIGGNKENEYKDRGLAVGSDRFLADKYDITYAQSVTSLMISRARNTDVNAPEKIIAFSTGHDSRINIADESSFSISSQIMLDSLKFIYSTSAVTVLAGCVNKEKIFEMPFHKYGVAVFDMPVIFSKRESERAGGIISLTLDETAGLTMNCDLMVLTGLVWPQKEDLDGYSAVEIGRAFQYVGSKDILLNLWHTDENASAIFYDVFFKNLKQRKTTTEAVFLAKKEIIKNGYVAPYYWAGYTLIKG